MEDLIYLDSAYLHYDTINDSGIGRKLVPFTKALKEAVTTKRNNYDEWVLSELRNVYEIADRVLWRLKMFIQWTFFDEQYDFLELRSKEF